MMRSVHAAAMATYVCKRGPSIFQSTIARHAGHQVTELDARAQNLPAPRTSQRRVAWVTVQPCNSICVYIVHE